MNVKEHLKNIYDKLKYLDGRVTTVAQSAGTHNLLSATHPDTDPSSPPVIGSIVRANLSREWEEYGIGAVGQVLTAQGAGDVPVWQDPAVGGGALFEDNFGDASLHWAWTTLNTGATKTITEAGGVVTIHVDALVQALWYTASNNAPTLHIDAPQFPCTITTKVDFDGAVPNLCEFGIFASCRSYSGSANGCWIFGRRRWDASGQNGLYANRWGTDLCNINPMTTLPVWLRIRVGGGHRIRSTVYFDYSTDGSSWTNLCSDSNSGQYPSTYGFTHGLYVRNWSAPYPQIDAEFDFFTMELSGGPG